MKSVFASVLPTDSRIGKVTRFRLVAAVPASNSVGLVPVASFATTWSSLSISFFFSCRPSFQLFCFISAPFYFQGSLCVLQIAHVLFCHLRLLYFTLLHNPALERDHQLYSYFTQRRHFVHCAQLVSVLFAEAYHCMSPMQFLRVISFIKYFFFNRELCEFHV